MIEGIGEMITSSNRKGTVEGETGSSRFVEWVKVL